MVERVDFYSDDEYQQACHAEEQYFMQAERNDLAEQEYYYQEYINDLIDDEGEELLP